MPKNGLAEEAISKPQECKVLHGPRTDRGRRNTKFNAVTLGLFAKHVVILFCDGEVSSFPVLGGL